MATLLGFVTVTVTARWNGWFSAGVTEEPTRHASSPVDEKLVPKKMS